MSYMMKLMRAVVNNATANNAMQVTTADSLETSITRQKDVMEAGKKRVDEVTGILNGFLAASVDPSKTDAEKKAAANSATQWQGCLAVEQTVMQNNNNSCDQQTQSGQNSVAALSTFLAAVMPLVKDITAGMQAMTQSMAR